MWKIEGKHFNSSSACVISNMELYTSTVNSCSHIINMWSYYQHVIILSTYGHIINMWSYYQHVVTVQEISALEQMSTVSNVYMYSLTNTLSSIQTKLTDVCYLHVQATYLLGMHSWVHSSCMLGCGLPLLALGSGWPGLCFHSRTHSSASQTPHFRKAGSSGGLEW